MDLLLPKTLVYYYVKETKVGFWQKGYVKRADDNIVSICSDPSITKCALQVASEDIRIVPVSSLLQELDRMELGGKVPCPDN